MNFFERFRNAGRTDDTGTAETGTRAADTLGTVQELQYSETATAELDAAAGTLASTGTLLVSHISDTDVPSLRIDGPCPRCGHPFSQTRALELPVTSIRGGQVAQTEIPTWADFLCDCGITHPGAPIGERGCGATYSLGCPTR